MVGGRAIIGQQGALGRPGIGLYNLNGITESKVIVKQTGTLEHMGIANASFTLGPVNSTLQFVLIQTLARANQFDLIPANAVNSSIIKTILACGGGGVTALQEHAHKTVLNVDFLHQDSTGGLNSTSPQPLIKSVTASMCAHIVLAFMAFGFLFPIGAAAAYTHARTPQNSSGWFEFHWIVQLASALIAIGAWISAIAYVQSASLLHFSNPHEILGMAIICAIVLQVLNGACRPHLTPRPNLPRQVWFRFHGVLGMFILISGGANIILGNAV